MSEEDVSFNFGAKKKKKATAAGAGAGANATPSAADSTTTTSTGPAAPAVADEDDGEQLDFAFGKKKKGKGVATATNVTTKAPSVAADDALAANDNDDDDDDGDDDDNNDDAADDDDDELDADAAAASAFMGDDDDDDAPSTGDQKKSTARGDGPVPWAGTTRDYSYDELVDRIFNILTADRPDLAGGARKKYQMKPPKVERDGTKKTLWVNFPEMCKAMHRLPDHVNSYVFAELGTTGSVDGTGRLVIKGRFQPKQIEKVVRHYIAEYVSCRTCRSPDTRLVKENRLQFIACVTCNSRRTVAAVRKGFEAQVGKRKKMRLAAEAALQKPGGK